MGACPSWWYRTRSPKLTTMAKNKEEKVKSPRFKEIRDAYAITKSVKPWIGLLLAALFLGTFGASVTIGALFDHPIYAGFIGFQLVAKYGLLNINNGLISGLNPPLKNKDIHNFAFEVNFLF